MLSRAKGPIEIRLRAAKAAPWLAACAGYLLLGCILLPYNGIEDNESLFALPIFGPVAREYRIRVFHRDIPLMVMDYVGALKSWIYSFIFRILEPSPISIRVPALLIGAVTICLFYRLLHQLAGRRAATVGCFLLATDTIFLMTTLFDWGPVAIQHLALVTGCVLLFAFHQTGSRKSLIGGFLALGLGIWDKAIFVWPLGGLLVAGLSVFPRSIVKRLSVSNIAWASIAFLLGAWPLLVYNARHQWGTFRNNAAVSTGEVAGKLMMLRYTIDGSGLFGYMVNDADAGRPATPETPLERASVGLAGLFGEPKENYLLGGACLTFALFPLWRRRWRLILFGVVFLAVTWIPMALTRNAGAAVHHTVLLWPFPHFILAIALSEAAERSRRIGRPALVAVVAFLCATNLLVTNQYLSQLIRYGPSVTWTDAIFDLSDSLKGYDGDVYVTDWGMFDTLLMLHEGRLRVHMIGGPGSELDRREIGTILARQRTVFVTHVPGKRVFPKADETLESGAAVLGCERRVLKRVADSHGRPVFELYTFAPAPSRSD